MTYVWFVVSAFVRCLRASTLYQKHSLRSGVEQICVPVPAACRTGVCFWKWSEMNVCGVEVAAPRACVFIGQVGSVVFF